MIKVSSQVELLPVEFDKEWKEDLADDQNPIYMEVTNFSRNDGCAILNLEGKRYSVVAADLIAALQNAANTGA